MTPPCDEALKKALAKLKKLFEEQRLGRSDVHGDRALERTAELQQQGLSNDKIAQLLDSEGLLEPHGDRTLERAAELQQQGLSNDQITQLLDSEGLL